MTCVWRSVSGHTILVMLTFTGHPNRHEMTGRRLHVGCKEVMDKRMTLRHRLLKGRQALFPRPSSLVLMASVCVRDSGSIGVRIPRRKG